MENDNFLLNSIQSLALKNNNSNENKVETPIFMKNNGSWLPF